MSHDQAITASPHGVSHGDTHAGAPFTVAELDALHSQDVAAGRAVVVLMCSIFLIGVLIYTIVALSIIF
ncbi:MAG: hypothetical protein WCL32_15160 [Planctomycetota bacterium]